VLVTAVTADTPAARAGLKAGDVIVDVAWNPVSNPAEVSAALANGVRDGHLDLHVVRDKKDFLPTATMPASPAPAVPFFRGGQAL
jgi:serine protease Do